MQVILLEKVVNLGQLGDVVRVKDGFARNFLIPQGMARRATDTAIADFQARRAELEKVQAEKLAQAQSIGSQLSLKSLRRPESMVDSSGRLQTSILRRL